MTTPVEEIAEQKKRVPPIKHAHCTRCQRGPGEVVALCGSKKRVGERVPLLGEPVIPAGACVVCADMLYKPCLLCGGSAW